MLASSSIAPPPLGPYNRQVVEMVSLHNPTKNMYAFEVKPSNNVLFQVNYLYNFPVLRDKKSKQCNKKVSVTLNPLIKPDGTGFYKFSNAHFFMKQSITITMLEITPQLADQLTTLDAVFELVSLPIGGGRFLHLYRQG